MEGCGSCQELQFPGFRVPVLGSLLSETSDALNPKLALHPKPYLRHEKVGVSSSARAWREAGVWGELGASSRV